MRTALWSILVLLCFFTGEISGCARRQLYYPLYDRDDEDELFYYASRELQRTSTSVDDSNTIHTFLPKYLFIDIPNRLIVHSSKPLTKITVNMIAFEQSSDDIGLTVFNNLEPTTIINSLRGHIKYVYNLKYLVPIEMEPGSPFNLLLNYFYCPEGGCRETEDETKITMVKTVQFMKHFTIIMGETDKPMYRPGDQIRFRFVALSSRQIVPYSGSLTWPEYRAVGSSWNDKYLEEIGEHERDRRMKPPYFDSIEVKDTLGNIVQQWKRVQALPALNLSHQLIADAKEGEWKIVAHVLNEFEEIKFNVRHYVLPRFQSRVEVPNEIQPTDSSVTFNVCATYTNGPPMPGTFDAQLCVCDRGIIEKHQTAAKQIERNECKEVYGPRIRTCLRYNGILEKVGCTSVTTNISQLLRGDPPNWADKLGVFVQVEEEGTGSSLVVSGSADFKVQPDPRLELKLPPTFRHGLPVAGQIVYKKVQELRTSSDLELKLYVQKGSAPREQIWRTKLNNQAGIMRTTAMDSEKEVIDFVLPPMDCYNSVNITTRLTHTHGASDSMPPSGTKQGGVLVYETSQILRLWDGSSGLAIQVSAVKDTGITCPGTLMLEVLSNQPLPTNTPLTLQFLSRGLLTTRSAILNADYTCTPHDNDFGHYTCDADGSITCLDGWGGDNCQIRICPADRTDFIGYQCKPAANLPNAPYRTVFKHTALFQLDGSYGPELRAVAFIVVDSEVASDYVRIENLRMCSSPALAQAMAPTYGLRFDKQTLVPGEKVNVTLTLPADFHSGEDTEGIANTCLLKMVDVAMKNCEKSNGPQIDLESWIKVLKKGKSASEIRDTRTAFREAGINFEYFEKPKTIKIPQEPFFGSAVRILLMSNKITWSPDVFVKSAPTVTLDLDEIKTLAPSYDFDLEIDEEEDKLISNFDYTSRYRDIFPQVWLFEAVTMTNTGFSRSLTVPDSLTSWEANAVCFTKDRGLWMPENKPLLTVSMPFFIEFTPPLVARRGEILHLPVSVFVYPPTHNVTSKQCYEVDVGLEVDPQDWRMIGASEFTTCICTGDLKETFKLPLRPLRIGQLNVTATATAARGSAMCGGDGRNVVVVGDAVRRSVRVVAEGVEKSLTRGGTFCTTGGSSDAQQQQQQQQQLAIELPDNAIVEGSLRTYITISGNVIGKALSNLDQLVQVPTGCGEQNLVKVAPSVYVLHYLLKATNFSSTHEDKLAKLAAKYIVRGFDNQLKYQHPHDGSFSTFGPHYGANGSTWLTAYVFEVFSEAEKLPLRHLAGQSLDAHATLVRAFDFLTTRLRADDGCFDEAGDTFISWMRTGFEAERRLRLTSHVLAAITAASKPLIETKRTSYANTIDSAIRCITKTAQQLPMKQWSTSMLAKVAFALSRVPAHKQPPLHNAIVTELLSRSQTVSSISGSPRWWPVSESSEPVTHPHSRAADLETTAYALLALSDNDLTKADQLATMRWISQQQNENGGFYSTQDTVVALRALTHASRVFPSPTRSTPVSVRTHPLDRVHILLDVNSDNQLVAHTFEVGVHNESDVRHVSVHIQSPDAVCISAHVTSIYNVAEAKTRDQVFDIEISTDQGGTSSTAACTTAITTVCLRSLTSEPTGMLLVTLQMPSGWTVSASELNKIALNASLQKMEVDAHKQEVSVYLNGFSSAQDTERCFTVPLHQRTFVEKAQPGLITAFDYYNPDEKVQSQLKLDSCQVFWDAPSGGILNDTSPVSSTTPAPSTASPEPSAVCPKCEQITADELEQRLNQSICHYGSPLYFFKPHTSDNVNAMPGLMYSLDYGRRLASWNTTLNIKLECECSLVTAKAFGFFGPYISAGDLDVELAGREVVSFEALNRTGSVFLKKTEVKAASSDNTEGSWNHWCSKRIAFSAALTKLSTLLATTL